MLVNRDICRVLRDPEPLEVIRHPASSAAVAGSDSWLYWRLGNKIGGVQDHIPNASRRSVLSAVVVETVRQELEPVNIPLRSWGESGDRLRQI